jgi:aspartate-semialdehyde dehydrogenase
MSFVVAVVGATGAVGREMLRVLEQRRFPIKRLVSLASKRSAGSRMPFAGSEVTVAELTPAAFQGVDIALFSAGASVSREFGPIAASAGAVVVDNSSAWRMDPDVPLVVPEVNMEAAANRPRGIIANPNCATIQMVVALKPLHDAARIKHVVVSTYQATSGKGHAAVTELLAQTRAKLDGVSLKPSVFPGSIAFNVLCDWKAGEDDYSEEETKIVQETKKIMGDPAIGVSPTTVRVPVVNGHSEALHVQFARPMSAAEARRLLAMPLASSWSTAPTLPENTLSRWRRRERMPCLSGGFAMIWRLPAPSIYLSSATICVRAQRSTPCKSPSG